jgi:hypothetical protein
VALAVPSSRSAALLLSFGIGKTKLLQLRKVLNYNNGSSLSTDDRTFDDDSGMLIKLDLLLFGQMNHHSIDEQSIRVRSLFWRAFINISADNVDDDDKVMRTGGRKS